MRIFIPLWMRITNEKKVGQLHRDFKTQLK